MNALTSAINNIELVSHENDLNSEDKKCLEDQVKDLIEIREEFREVSKELKESRKH